MRFPVTGKSNGQLVFTVHSGKKDSKKKPYTGIEDFCHSYKGKDFEVNFKIKSEKTDDDAKKLVKQMITDLKREFASEPKEQRETVKSSAAASLFSARGSAGTPTQPSATVSQAATTLSILSRGTDPLTPTQEWARTQYVIEEFTKELSTATEDVSDKSEQGE